MKFLPLLLLLSNTCFATQITKSNNDVNSYRHLKLDNGIKVILVSNPHAEKAAAALSVNIGSLHNPKEYPGMAHFLEHMLFLGTKKYPHEAEYHEFIEANGGSRNAYTALENTVYMFDINPDSFAGGLDRFSQFFIAPLFTEDLINREINAIDSEFNLKINDNNTRDWRLLQIISHPDHSFSRFTVGNKATLASNQQKTLREAVINFYHNNYNPQLMTLALESNHSLDELEKYVREYFSSIQPYQDINKQTNLDMLAFTKQQTGKKFNIQPIGQIEKLMLLFPLPNQAENYKTKPDKYVTNLINATHEGSLYQFLRQHNLITKLDAGSFRLTNTQDLLSIDFSLTREGLNNIDYITELFFSYINWLKANGIQEWIYNEAVTADIREFKFQEPYLPLDHVIDLANALTLYPAKDILNNSFLTKKSKLPAGKIKAILDDINPYNMLMIIESPSTFTDQTEALYNIKYKIAALEKEQLEKLVKNIKPDNQAWLLATKNSYLPSNFSLNPIAQPQEFPSLIENERLWFKKDNKFKLPLIQANFILKTDLITASVKNKLCTQLLVKMLADSLNPEAAKLKLAGAEISYSLDDNNFIINTIGYSDKMTALIQLAAHNLTQTHFSKERFTAFKKELQDSLANYKNRQLYAIAYSDAQYALYPRNYSPAVALPILEAINLEDVLAVQHELLQSFIPESFIYGNITKEGALELKNKFFTILNLTKLYLDKLVSKEPYIKLPENKDYVWFINPNNTESNALVALYQANPTGYQARGIIALLAQLIDPAIFAQLRTKEQLGYVVGITPQRHLDATGLLFYIESPKSKSSYLLARLENFLQDFHTKLINMAEAEFDTNKQALIHSLRIPPKTFTAQAQAYFSNILEGSYQFNSQIEIANLLENITKEEVISFYNKLLLDSASKRRLLSVTLDETLKSDPHKAVITNLKEFQTSAEIY